MLLSPARIPSFANACSIASAVILDSSLSSEIPAESLFSGSARLVLRSRIHLRWSRPELTIGMLIEHFRDSVGPALGAIEVLPYLQLTQKSDSYQMEPYQYQYGREY